MLNGLVLAGGLSTRMGKNKALLEYFDIPQWRFAADQLQPFCRQVYISVASEAMANELFTTPVPYMLDATHFSGHGPLSGLLTACELFPDASWMIHACDYPSITQKEWAVLFDHFEKTQDSVCYEFENPSILLPFPSILSSMDAKQLIRGFHQKKWHSISLAFRALQINTLPVKSPETFVSIDTTEQYLQFKKNLS